jgi:hypothetical protein
MVAAVARAVTPDAHDEAGHSYEIEVVGGQLGSPWTWSTRQNTREPDRLPTDNAPRRCAGYWRML